MYIRCAQVDEHKVLSRIALEAKAHWGYCAEDLARWEADLTVSADSLTQLPTFVAEMGRYIAGFFQLSFASDSPKLEHFWVLPAFMGKGVGRALLERAVREAAERGNVKLLIDADPNAERFYIACGAVRTGEKPAPAAGQPQRVRPQLVLSANATQLGNAPDARDVLRYADVNLRAPMVSTLGGYETWRHNLRGLCSSVCVHFRSLREHLGTRRVGMAHNSWRAIRWCKPVHKLYSGCGSRHRTRHGDPLTTCGCTWSVSGNRRRVV